MEFIEMDSVGCSTLKMGLEDTGMLENVFIKITNKDIRKVKIKEIRYIKVNNKLEGIVELMYWIPIIQDGKIKHGLKKFFKRKLNLKYGWREIQNSLYSIDNKLGLIPYRYLSLDEVYNTLDEAINGEEVDEEIQRFVGLEFYKK